MTSMLISLAAAIIQFKAADFPHYFLLSCLRAFLVNPLFKLFLFVKSKHVDSLFIYFF